MNHEKIRTWLGMSFGSWPPDHYTLLGLSPGEKDMVRIEHHVHERMSRLRGYQLSNPDLVTEAMNRLAQAFMCLTDPEAKNAYDRTILGDATLVEKTFRKNGQESAAAAPPKSPPGVDDTAICPRTQVDWKNLPPPVRSPSETPPEAVAPETNLENLPEALPIETAPPASSPPNENTSPQPALDSKPADPIYESARASVEARRGLATLHSLLERIDLTRKLLWNWDQLGKYVNKPKRRLTRTVEQKNLVRRLDEIGELMEAFPRIMGQPGQPGYRVLALARLEMSATLFNMLDPQQRADLARDWLAGRLVLLAHRNFLLREFKIRRRQNVLARGLHAGRAALNDHPAWVFLTLGLAGLGVALFYLI